MASRILRRPEAARYVGLAASSFDDLRRRDASFPKPIAIGARSVGFFEAEILAWLESRPRIGADEQPSTGTTKKPASPNPRSVGTPA